MRPLAHAPLAGLAVALGTALGGCAGVTSPDSPDLAYSERSVESRSLQVPPDLTDISDAEQFVLPGTDGGAITRNTLLPAVDGVRFERGGEQAWLAFDTAPEALWQPVVDFLVARGFEIDRTSPVAGTIATRWRPVGDGESDGGVLRGLIGGGKDARSRVAFRLERAAGDGARLFARRQVAPGKAVDAGTVAEWPASSADPEATDTLLAQLLVFLGLEVQRAEGLLDASAAADVLDDAVVRTNVAGSQLVVHRGYRSALEALDRALAQSGLSVRDRDDAVGRITFADPGGDPGGDSGSAAAATALSLVIEPVHIGAVRVALVDADGRRIAAERERELLGRLAAQLV